MIVKYKISGNENKKLILNGKVNFPVALAPMVGLSHKALRLVLRSYLPQDAVTWWPTEMLNSRRLPYEDLNSTPESMKGSTEGELCPQILGNDPHFIKLSVQKLETWGAEGIDINMGCPVTKALRHNYGVALMGDADYAARVVDITKKASGLPVSVKLRAGLQNDFDYLYQFVNKLIYSGVDWVTLHPRIASEQRRGAADWGQIERLKKLISIPLIGNGDIQTSEDVKQMFELTHCDGVMVGRALAARPWLLWQLGEDWGFSHPNTKGAHLKAPRTPEEEAQEYLFCLELLLSLLLEDLPQSLAFRKFRFHVRTTHVWLDFGHRLYADLTKGEEPQDLIQVLRRYQEFEMLKMSPKTELRQ